MHEKALYPEIERTVETYGGYWKRTNDLHFVRQDGKVAEKRDPKKKPVMPRKGDPDFAWIFPQTGRGAVVEVKHADEVFALSQISTDQRAFLDFTYNAAFLWLSMGIRIGARNLPRKAWLIPWRDWLQTERLLLKHDLKSLAHTRPFELRHREAGLSACQLLRPFELQYVQGPNGYNHWTLNEHALYYFHLEREHLVTFPEDYR